MRVVGKSGQNAVRLTTTLTVQQKQELDRMAAENGVKVAWLIRRAVERMLEQAKGAPLLPLEFKTS
jgi:hypothetical protein